MAPARSSARRTHHDQNVVSRAATTDGQINDSLFLEPMMGTPLQIFIEKDVDARDILVDLVTKHGGTVSPGYSGVPYILVDPHKESGQSLYRQYVGKKGKIVLNSRWIHECIKAGALQTFHSNWAGCKVDGTEVVGAQERQSISSTSATTLPTCQTQQRQNVQPTQVDPRQIQPLHAHPAPIQPGLTPVDPLVHPQFQYQVYVPRQMQTPTAAPPQTWQTPSAIVPQPAHMLARPPHPYREEWNPPYDQAVPPASTIVGGPAAPGFEYRYRDDHADWVGGPNDYYDQSYEQSYEHAASFLDGPGTSTASTSAIPTDVADKGRGRKRTRIQPNPAPHASTLVVNRRNPPGRSPTPPTRVIKSTYGGNLFTSDDVVYLKKYIDYCQEQGLVLSLREICERIAVKAPHHTFYSWRRYCNKHQIRLGGYAMNADRSPSPQGVEQEPEDEEDLLNAGPGPGTVAAARQETQPQSGQTRSGSPTPPRALFRSTTGKGVAFTDEDVTFLVRFMEYRKSQGRVDMVAFWKDVATKAPHHSRASWMKFWRRHKHELNRTENDDPLPQPPEKKMRYSRGDDILLAEYFFTKPEGTSDKIFQAFGRMPHHPWKGWQEHHRIHKAKIDHFIQRLTNGEMIDSAEPAGE